MDLIYDGIYISSDLVPECDEQILRTVKISAILRVMDTPAPDDAQLMYVRNNIDYYYIYMRDEPEFPIVRFFHVTNQIIDANRSHGKKILVHCASGMSLSPTIVAAYLLFSGVCSREQVIWYIRSRRRVIEINQEFLRHLPSTRALPQNNVTS